MEAVGRLAELDEIDEQLGPARKQKAADAQQQSERERSQRYGYEPCAFLSSAVIAGTTSARSPITA